MTADTILVNVKGITLDAANPRCEALAIRGERILYVGSEPETMALRGADTQVIDGGGNSLIPGIIDSHFHLLWGSLRLAEMQLGAVRNLDDLHAVITQYRAEHPDKAVLRGSGLSYDILPDGARLTRQQLDAIEPMRPLILTSFDFHSAWCNTAALQAAGLLHGASLPSHAEVVMGVDGFASGELREFEALQPVYALVPELTEPEKRTLIRQGMHLANSYGITSIHNMNGNAEEYARYINLDQAGELTLRIYAPFSFSPEMDLNLLKDAMTLGSDYQSPRLKAGALKLFMDGVVESFTALMLEPYPNTPQTCGEALYAAEQFAAIAGAADKLGLQVVVHAIGDAAVRRTLDGYAAARRANGPRDSRHRIEHIELLHPDDLPRFGELGVIASMQPYHCTRPEVDYLTPYLDCIPKARYQDAFPWQSLRAAGAKLCFGSDWPVVSMNPFLGFDAAINRSPWRDDLPSQAQSRLDTLHSYTHEAAYAEFAEHDKGQLKAGMLADLVLLSADLLTTPASAIATVQAELTLVGGKVCFRR
jgi:predicted amidohydrolase YtcJ